MFVIAHKTLWSFMLLASIQAFTSLNSPALTLPLPAHIDDGDQLMVHAVSLLQVYPDQNDSNHYYYVPPMVLNQQKEGALFFKPHKVMIEVFAALGSIIKQRKNYDHDELARLQKELAISNRGLQIAQAKLQEPQVLHNEDALRFWRKVSYSEQKEQLRSQQNYLHAKRIVDSGSSLLSQTISDSFNQKARALLARAGFTVKLLPPNHSDVVFAEIEQKTWELAASYGGYMSITTIAGLSEWHLAELRRYKKKYMPHLRITLLPIEKLRFFPLQSAYSDPALGTQNTPMLKNEEIMTDYLGGTLFFSLTVLGASGWLLRLGSHILPIGLSIGLQGRTRPFITPGPQTQSISTNFCVSYNEKLKNYDRCSNDQHEKSQAMAQLMEETMRSPLCQHLRDPYFCGSLRSLASKDTPRTL